MAPHSLAVRVYYEDTDFSGVVYHASYLRFLERGRTEFLRALGIAHRGGFGADGFHFVVRAMTVEFLKPALMDDELCVETHPSATRGAAIDMTQKIRRGGDGKTLDREFPLVELLVHPKTLARQSIKRGYAPGVSVYANLN